MAFELLFTSVPRGLRPGSSGYCAVSQTRGIPEDLAGALERRSRYVHEPGNGAAVAFGYRPILSGGKTYRVLSRAVDAGLDFTGRRHFLAHHLALRPGETVHGRQPAEILLGWSGWQERWSGAPQETEEIRMEEVLSSLPRIRLPAVAWKKAAGDAAWAAFPLHRNPPVGWYSNQLDSAGLLRLMAESLCLAEAAQPEKSWSLFLDVAGPATPPGKEVVWFGRGPMAATAGHYGARSFFQIEDLTRRTPEGDEAEIQLARSGRAPARAQASGRPRAETGRNAADLPETLGGEAGSWRAASVWSDRRRRWLVAALGLSILATASAIFWKFHPQRDSAGVTAPPEVPVLPPEAPAVPPPPAPRKAPPGEALRDSFWKEAGGRAPIDRLYLLFGQPPSAQRIREEILLMEQEGTEPRVYQTTGGVAAFDPTKAGADLESWSEEASRTPGPWSLRTASEATARGLAYLPDVPGKGSEGLSVARRSPEEILAELGQAISWPETRWSIWLSFAPWERWEFPPVKILSGEPAKTWVNRVAHQAGQIREIRNQSLRQLAPWLGQDPSLWDESRIRTEAADWKRFAQDPKVRAFLRIQEEYEQWWAPLEAPAEPEEIFQRLLRSPRTMVELRLDEELVIRKLVP